jgi:prepilin-type N-terminal cleavage/methylation domain-containing protein/prepilin-type processing-associated H-X9-DG protein
VLIMTCASPHKGRRGITLVEVLIVIAMLSILLAVLAPFLRTARTISYRTQCANNLRHFSSAFNLYATDWNNNWPCPGGLRGDRSYWSQTGPGGVKAYLKQSGVRTVWCCPLQTEWKSHYPARTYGMNSYLREPADVEYPGCVGILNGINMTRIPEPRNTILLYEGVALTTGWENSDLYNYIYRCANWMWVRGFTANVAYAPNSGRPWHGRFNNYLYCDGHIVARPPGKCVLATLSTYREMYEWYVDKQRFRNNFRRWSAIVPLK